MCFSSLLIDYFPEVYYSILRNDNFYQNKSLMYRFVSYLLPFIAPIPRLIDANYPKDLYIHSLSLVKSLFSGFAMYGSYVIVKKNQTDFYPLLLISLFTGLLLIVSVRMIDYRYAYITMPSFYILMFYGIRYYSVRFFVGYLAFVLVVIAMLNLGGY